MAELALSHDQVIALRASAHGLDPVVLMGAAGLSPALLKEIDRALRAHGLVKVRGGKSERAEREAMFLAMAEQLEAARVQVIGNTFHCAWLRCESVVLLNLRKAQTPSWRAGFMKVPSL